MLLARPLPIFGEVFFIFKLEVAYSIKIEKGEEGTLISYSKLAESVIFNYKGATVRLDKKDKSLKLIGKGRSAFVFRIGSSGKAMKVFFEPFLDIAKEEAAIYKILQGHSNFPTLYEAGPNYLVIDFIEGETLFQCLNKGIRVSKANIEEVQMALNGAKDKGLNPSDIHLRNIILTTEGEIKLIDVARFRQIKNCTQWDDIKAAFYKYYSKRFFPKRYPKLFLNIIAELYKKRMVHGKENVNI
jgi:predicted Ser/Thr protein kinase